MELNYAEDVPGHRRTTEAEDPTTTTSRSWQTMVDGFNYFEKCEPSTNVSLYLSEQDPPGYGHGYSISAKDLTTKGLRQLGEWLIAITSSIPEL